jgi:effector-binding domain-containing protein
VLAVKVDGRDGYAAAFGRLVGFYLKHRVQVIFPQMSLEADGTSLAAIAFDGNATADSDVTIMTLPAALVAVQPHIGPYGTLSQSIAKTIDAAQQWGCTPDTSRYLRLLHRNSPDDTPADKLVTEIQIPVTGCRS